MSAAIAETLVPAFDRNSLGNRLGLVWYKVRQSPLTLYGLAIITVVFATMALAGVIAPYDPNAVSLEQRLLPPSALHWFGTDEVGRDLFSRILYGSRQSVSVGLFVVPVAGIIGSTLGCFSGSIGGKVDMVMMRITDIVLSVPSLVLTMALAAALGPSLFNAMLAITVVRIPSYIRLARGQALIIREMNYSKASLTFGASRWHVVRWHVLINALPPLIVQATLDVGGTILMAAALGFIGLGAQQPTAEWGAMVATGRNYILDQWWYSGFPGFAILITATGFNLFGDGLRDNLDPKQKAS
jgi:peptide/nickel transport system permease protein